MLLGKLGQHGYTLVGALERGCKRQSLCRGNKHENHIRGRVAVEKDYYGKKLLRAILRQQK